MVGAVWLVVVGRRGGLLRDDAPARRERAARAGDLSQEPRARRGRRRGGAARRRPGARRRPAARATGRLRRGVGRRRGRGSRVRAAARRRPAGRGGSGVGVVVGRRLRRPRVGGLRRGVGRRRRAAPARSRPAGWRRRAPTGRASARSRAAWASSRRAGRRARRRRPGWPACRPSGARSRRGSVVGAGRVGVGGAAGRAGAVGGGACTWDVGGGDGDVGRRGGRGERGASGAGTRRDAGRAAPAAGLPAGRGAGRRSRSGSARASSRWCPASPASGPEPAIGQRAARPGPPGRPGRPIAGAPPIVVGCAANEGRPAGCEAACGGASWLTGVREPGARPGVAEGQDVAAQQREAGADQRASHDRAGEPREGGPGPSVAESDHSGRNIDANGQSLKSQEWAVSAPENRFFRVLIAFPTHRLIELGALALVLPSSGSASCDIRRAAVQHPSTGDRRPLDLPQSCACASHAAGRPPRWSSPSSPCSSRSAAPPRPEAPHRRRPAAQEHVTGRADQERHGRQGRPEQGRRALADRHAGALGALGADRRRPGARARPGRRGRGPGASSPPAR